MFSLSFSIPCDTIINGLILRCNLARSARRGSGQIRDYQQSPANLEAISLAPDLPEDLCHLIKKAESYREEQKR